MQSLVVPADLRARLIDVARAALPNESCGFLAGSVTGEASTVDAVYPVVNALASPTSFALDGKSMIDAERRIDDDGHVVLGVFHSHPASPAVPSKRDVDDAARYDPTGMYVHVIVSMQGFVPNVRAYTFGGGVHEIPIRPPAA